MKVDELSNLDGLQIHLRFQCCKGKTSGKTMWWFFSQKVTGSFLPTDKFDMDFQKVTFIFDFRLKECCNFEVKPFLANVPIYTPWKQQKTFGFLVFLGGGYKMETLARNGLQLLLIIWPANKYMIKINNKKVWYISRLFLLFLLLTLNR